MNLRLIILTLAVLSLLSGIALAGFGESKSISHAEPGLGQYESSMAAYYEQPPPLSEQQALLAYSPSQGAAFYYGGKGGFLGR